MARVGGSDGGERSTAVRSHFVNPVRCVDNGLNCCPRHRSWHADSNLLIKSGLKIKVLKKSQNIRLIRRFLSSKSLTESLL